MNKIMPAKGGSAHGGKKIGVFKITAIVSAIVLVSSIFAFPQPARALVPPNNPGDVLINEFLTVPSGASEWYELLNTTGSDINLAGWTIERAVPGNSISLSGTLPANGILVFSTASDPANDAGNMLTLKDSSPTTIHAVSYGDVDPGGDVPHSSAPAADGSAYISDYGNPLTYSVTDSPSKGWFNDAGTPGKAPLLEDIDEFMAVAGIISNIGELDNPSATPDTEDGGALYFEKEGRGKIVFETTLNLSDQNTVAVLQELGEKMEMSDGHIEFDSATADAMNATGAKIYMFGLDFASEPNIVVKDDDDNIISGIGIIEDVSYDPETGELSFTAAHFTQFDAELPVNNETKGERYNTIQAALSDARPGDTISVASGTYAENLEFDEAITLVGDIGDEEAGPGEDAPVITDNTDCSDRVISIEANDVTIKGFVIDGDGCDKPVVRVDQEISGAEISDNEIRNGKKGVDLSPDSNENTVTNNLIHDNDNYGVWIGGSTDNTISDNEIYGNSTGIGLGEGGDGESGNVSGNEITGNYIHDNETSDTGIHVEDVSFSELTISDNNITSNGSDGIYIDAVTDGSLLTISGNEITENSENGIYIESINGNSTVNITDNSAISQNRQNGIRIDDTYNSTVLIDGNTIDGNDDAGIYVGDAEEGTEDEGDSTLTVTNNTITDNGEESETTGIHINWVDAGTDVKVNFNSMTGNGFGLLVNSIEEGRDDIDAINNWWGDVTGPAHDSNPGGTGDEISDFVDFSSWYANVWRTILSSAVSNDDTVTPTSDENVRLNLDNSGQADLPEGITNLVLNDDSNLDLSDGLNEDDAVTLQSGVEGGAIVLSNADLEGVTVTIPDGTLITGPEGWDGIIEPPKTGSSSGTAPAGFSVGSTVISVGSPDGTLVFDSPVTIVLTGVTGTVGYRPSGSDIWQTITNICGGTYNEPTPPTEPGECSKSNGTDTKIVTYHFTTFGSLNTVSSGGGGGGGGGGGFQASALNLSKTGNGTVISLPAAINCGPICNSTIVTGQTVTLTATPTSPSSFAGWGGDCAASGTNPTCTLVMNVAKSVTAIFTSGQVLGTTSGFAHPNGTLILSGQTVYLLKGGQRYGFRNPQEFRSYGYKFSQTVLANAADMLLPLNPEILKAMTGTLVLDAADRRTVYMIGLNYTKRGFTTPEVFLGLGYSFANTVSINVSDYFAGPVINSSTEAHPEGALVSEGLTIWWILAAARQGFESEAVFNTYGFSFARVATSNTADLALSIGPLVKLRDGTLVNDSGTYYIVSDGKKLQFASGADLTAKGYSLSNVISASLSGYTSGGSVQ